MRNPSPSAPQTLILFGVDPGSRNLGYGWIEVDAAHPDLVYARGCGVLRAPAKNDVATRLAQLMQELQEIFDEHKPAIVTVEKVYLGKSVESAFTLGQARGVVLALAARVGAVVREEAAVSAKKSVTGNGSSEKTEVRLMLSRLLKMGPELDSIALDASDALALAYHTWRRICVERSLGAQTRTP